MTIAQLNKLFKDNDDEFLKFKNIPVTRRLSSRPDLNAFMLLDQLAPGDEDMVSCAEHDEIYLSLSRKAVASLASEEQILDLIRCGLRLDDFGDGFAMFV